MSFWLINSIVMFVLCVLGTGIVIPKILAISFKKKLYDVPDERKIHKLPIPRLGGVSFQPVLFFSLALVIGANILFNQYDILNLFSGDLDNILQFLFVFCAIHLLYMVGLVDDLIEVRYRTKFVAQIFCTILLIAGGIYINNFYGIIGIHNFPAWIAYPFTVLLIIFIINAMNLIDGIDGLASGLACMALLTYGVIFFYVGEYLFALMAFGSVGVLLAFFAFNVWGDAVKKQKIFMGDAGSLTVGIVLAIMSIKISQCTAAHPEELPFNPIVLGFSPLLVPCLDVIRVYFKRIRHHKNPFLPDKSHIHHKLLAMGFNQHTTLIIIISFAVLWTILNVILSYYINVNWIVLIDAILWIGLNMWISSKIRLRREKQKASAEALVNKIKGE